MPAICEAIAIIALVPDFEDDAFDVDITPDLSHLKVSGGTLDALELGRALAELSGRARRAPSAAAALR
jgi:hypothetical protein